jgi:hypothetical protein
MMRFFRRRRPLDDFMEGIRPELQSLPTPTPTEELRARILSSRAGGGRTILPDTPDEKRLPSGLAIGFAIAAGLVVLLVPIELRRSAIGADLGSPGVFERAASASTLPPVAGPELTPLRFTAPQRLRQMSLDFERRLTDSTGRRIGVHNIAIHVGPSSVDGVTAWRLVSEDRELRPGVQVDVETVFVARADARLLRRTLHVSPYRRFQRINLWQDFPGGGDSVTGRMNTEGPSIGAGRTYARRLPPAFAPYITDRIAAVLLMAAPLHRDFSASASLIGWAVRDDDIMIPVELRVEGEETITVPAGRFDCWRLSVRFSGGQVDYWARKSDGLGVRVVNRAGPAKNTREIVLTRVSE